MNDSWIARTRRWGLQLVSRGKRYIAVYAWLFSNHLRYCGRLFIVHQLLAVGGRVGTIFGLVATAHLLAHLISTDKKHIPNLPLGITLDSSQYKALLVAIPLVLLLSAALFQRSAVYVFGKLQFKLVTQLADDYAARLSAVTGSELPGGGYARVYFILCRVDLYFLQLVQNFLVLTLVVIASVAVIGLASAAVSVFVFAVFIFIFILLRQGQSHKLHSTLQSLNEERMDILRKLNAERSGAGVAETKQVALMERFPLVLHQRYFLLLRFKELSRSFSLVVQAGLAGLLLIYVATADAGGPHDFARLISLFVIMRFCFGTVQGINSAALAIAPDYTSLVCIKDGRPLPHNKRSQSPAVSETLGDETEPL